MKATVNTIPLYNWGSNAANNDHYGQPTPPLVDVSLIEVPSAFFVAQTDPLGDQTDAYTASLKEGYYSKHYEVISGGHSSFLVGKDMSFMGRVINLINQYGANDVDQQTTT